MTFDDDILHALLNDALKAQVRGHWKRISHMYNERVWGGGLDKFQLDMVSFLILAAVFFNLLIFNQN